jgi:L-rhamnose mutarotase
MQGFGTMIRLKAGLAEEYKRYHAAVWHRGVEQDLGGRLENPRGWAVVSPMQDSLPTSKEGEWWAEMEAVFHLD